MPITIKDVTLLYKILPIELRADGSSRLTVRKGYQDGDNFVDINTTNIEISVEETQQMLNEKPTEGLTRLEDLAFAIYQWLIANHYVEDGVIS